MTYERVEKILLWTAKGSIYAALLAPLLLSADYFFPAIFPKAVYIRLLVEVALIAYIPLAWAVPKYRPQKHIIYLALAAFAAVVLASSLAGVNFSFSFWGNYERMDGIFSWLHFWLLIVVAGSIFTEKPGWQKLFSASIGVALLLAGYGFLQKWGIGEFGPVKVYDVDAQRITSTIGNPGFLAVYLLFNCVLALNIIIDKARAVAWRWAAAISLVILFWAFLLTGIRGAWFGFLVGLAVFFIGYFLWIKTKARRIVLGVLGCLFVVITLLFVFRTSALVKRSPFLNRNFNLSINDSTVQTRLISWRGALSGLPDNLWLGVGPQKFDVIFNKNFDPRFYILVGNETWWDRAHNMALEVLATMGIIGLLSYLSIGLTVLYSLWRLGKADAQARVEALLWAGFFIAYFIQNLFVFDSITSYLMLSLALAYIVWRTYIRLPNFFPRRAGPGKLYFSLAVVFIAVAVIAYPTNIKLIKHNRLLLNNLARQFSQPSSVTIANYRAILDLSDFDQREVVIKIGQYLGQRGLSGSMTAADLIGGYNFFIAAADKAIKANPEDVRLLLSYGNAVNVYGELMKSQDAAVASQALQKAERALLAAAALGRSRQQVFYSLANTYLIAGDNQKGIAILEEAARLHEDTPTTYWLLAFAYQQAKDNDKAIMAADKALDKNYVFSAENEANPIASLYLERKDYDRLLRLYKRVAETAYTGTAQARLAALYAQMGRKDEALVAADAVIARDPSLRTQVEEFIQQVKSGTKKDFLGL